MHSVRSFKSMRVNKQYSVHHDIHSLTNLGDEALSSFLRVGTLTGALTRDVHLRSFAVIGLLVAAPAGHVFVYRIISAHLSFRLSVVYSNLMEMKVLVRNVDDFGCTVNFMAIHFERCYAKIKCQ